MSEKKLVTVMVNKHFEVEPFIAALMTLSNKKELGFPKPLQLNIPTDGLNRMNKPRAYYEGDKLNFDVEVWCIEDLMNPVSSASNSEQKYNDLCFHFSKHFREKRPELVISVSTAESTPDIQGFENDIEPDSINGSVIFGDKFFMFDASDFDKESESSLKFDVDYSNGEIGFWNYMQPQILSTMTKYFWEQENAKAKAEKLLCDGNSQYLSVGVVNVTNYSAYKEADPAAYKAAEQIAASNGLKRVCIETTHGIVNSAVIYSCNEIKVKTVPVLFASPITDRYERFESDVGTSGVQNYIAGYNGGAAVGCFLKYLNNIIE